MSIIFGSDKSGNANNWTSNSLDNSASTTTTVAFTTVGGFNWTAPAGVTSVSYLVVAGGGGGGSGNISSGRTRSGGGGGGGGTLYGSLSVTPGTSYAIAIGAAGIGSTSESVWGTNGGNSTFASIVSYGGGGGGSSANEAGQAGGSGGGAATTDIGGAATPAGQGNAGANGGANSGSFVGGGGGGATTAGSGRSGGSGYTTSISGTSSTYGIGGDGGLSGSQGNTSTSYYGSGGGGGAYSSGTKTGANGTSGIIILSYSAATTTYDSMVDVPGIANAPSQQDVGGVVPGNYCTLNPLANGTNLVTDSGLLSVSNSSTEANHRTARATMGVSSGKWYWEVHVNNSANVDIVGIVTDISAPNNYVGATANSIGWGYNTSTGNGYAGDGWVFQTGTPPAHPSSGVIGVAFDADEGRIWFSNNGTWLSATAGVGNPSVGAFPWATFAGSKTTTFFPAVSIYNNTGTWVFNFGQRAFKFAPPAGFKSLNTTNLPNPVIKRPSDHFNVKTYTGNGTNLTVGTTAKQSSAYQINKSLVFRKSSQTTLSRSYASAPTSRTTMTMSAWVKRGTLSAGTTMALFGTANNYENVTFFTDDTIRFTGPYSSSQQGIYITNQAFKDTTAWYHIVAVYDTTNANAINRMRLYVNGTQITSFSTRTVSNLNNTTTEFLVNGAFTTGVGTTGASGYGSLFDGYMAEVNVIDGQALSPSAFGDFDANNNWMPKTYTGTYGNNGFYLPFTSPSVPDTASYAGKFNNTSQYLTVAGSAATNFGTGDFTIEGWFNLASLSSSTDYQILFNNGVAGATQVGLYYRPSGPRFEIDVNGSVILSANYTVTVGNWYHFAVVRSSTTSFKLFINGQQVATGTSSYTQVQQPFYIGGIAWAGNYGVNGYLSNYRFVKGTAIYTSNFIPSTSPLTAVTGTSLLTLQNSTIIDNSTNAFSITNSGSVTTIDASPWRKTVGSDASGNNNNFYLNGLNTVPTASNAPNVLYYGTPGTYSWTAPAGVTSVNYLVVAGGGGGGGDCAGGGGGGMLTGTLSVTPSTSYTVTVGAGGLTAYPSTNGKNSVFSSITAIGGGSGGDDAYAGGNGGSGGGGGYNAGAAAGTGTAGQGNNGGSGQSGSPYATGGGGGAGGVGAPYNTTGNGGPGLASSISGTTTYYAGGGGGRRASPGVGGIGGGGTANLTLPAGANGVDGLGGGGGGSGNGGSGVVILSYTNAASYSGNGVGSSIGNDATFSSPVDTVDSNGNTIGNYAVLNPTLNSGSATISNGNLSLYSSNSGAHKIVPATLPISSGKWYFEMTLTGGTPSNAYVAMGLIPYPVPTNSYYTNLPSSVSGTNGFSWQTAGSSTTWTLWTDYDSAARYVTITTGAAAAVGDTMQIAIDIDNSKIWAGKNNVWYDASGGSTGNPSTGANPTANNVNRYISQYGALVPFCSIGQWNTSTVNFGQSPFVFTPPTGFKSINTKNIKDAGSTNLPDSFGNFVNSPDLVWIKNRTEASGGGLWNTLLGKSSFLQTSNTNGPATTSGELETFLPNGFQVGTNTNITNKSGNAYAAWCWNKGKTPGFDIVTFGSTGGVMQVPHNLGQVPKFIIIKGTNGVTSWETYHSSVGPLSNVRLDSDAGLNTGADWFNNTSPTSTHFTIAANNPAGYTWIAYLWAEVPGFSKMGSYTGNATSPGPFVYCGFRPAFVLIKGTSTSRNWVVFDNKRTTFNSDSATARFILNTATTESGNERIDFLSNGFKLNTYTYDANAAETYIYVAFAESPFKYANAR